MDPLMGVAAQGEVEAVISLTIVRDGDQWVINGSKMCITNSIQADWLCVLARTFDAPGQPSGDADRQRNRGLDDRQPDQAGQ